MKEFFTKNRYYLFLTIYFLGFGIIIALITSVINYRTEFHDIEETLCEISTDESNRKVEYLTSYVKRNEREIYSISQNDITKGFIKNQNQVGRSNLEDLFSAIIYSNSDIMQLRYINELGQEVIRIDRDKDSSSLNIIPKEQLQDKSDRYYFKESVAIDENGIWHSNLDLNIENGEIEIPYNPTFRLATPIYIDGINKGVIISNLMFSSILDELVYSTNFDINLMDMDGEILYNSENKNVWSRYIDGTSNIYDKFPEMASQIMSEESLCSETLFTYNIGSVFNNEEHLKIIFSVKSDTIDTLKSENLFRALIIALTVFLISIPLSWIVSVIPSNLQSRLNTAFDEIKEQSDIIDENVMIIRADNQGFSTDISKSFTKVTGYSKEELIGKKHKIFQNEEMCHDVKKGNKIDLEVEEKTKNNESLWLQVGVSPKLDTSGSLESLTAICENITDKKRIELMSETDTLTGLNNRRRLLEVFNKEKSRAERYNDVFSVIIYDIDFFKKVNDLHGHLVGDDVLKTLSDIVKDNTRENDYIYRWGGEEFLIISTNKNVYEAAGLAEKLRLIVEKHKFDKVGSITISCGVTQFENGDDLESMIARADVGLYDAKTNGRNKVVTKV